MLLQLDNNQRRFLIQSSQNVNQNYICNLHDIPTVLQSPLDKMESYTIKHLWNGKFQRVSKKFVNEMLTGAEINFQIK